MNVVDDTSKTLGGQATTSEDQPTFLSVIIETHPEAWERLKDQITFKEAIQALLVFINGHIALNNTNRVCVIASHGSGASFLYPLSSNQNQHSTSSTYGVAHAQSMYRQFRDVDESVYRAVVDIMESSSLTSPGQVTASLSGALSLALTYINKFCSLSDEVRIKSRILVISVTDDTTSQYISTMNCIFAAQKQRIPIDVCKLGGSTSFLQQACDSTNGIFMKIKHAHGLVQYLLSAYSVEPTLRPHINLSTQRDVDFRAVCFITKNVVDIGFVCSVCLCIMSIILPSGDCPMCGTEFGEDVIKRLLRKPVVLEPRKKKKKKVESNGNGTPAP